MLNWIKSKLGYKYTYLVVYLHDGSAVSHTDIRTTAPLVMDDIAKTCEVMSNCNDNVKSKNVVILNIMFLGMSKNG